MHFDFRPHLPFRPQFFYNENSCPEHIYFFGRLCAATKFHNHPVIWELFLSPSFLGNLYQSNYVKMSCANTRSRVSSIFGGHRLKSLYE